MTRTRTRTRSRTRTRTKEANKKTKTGNKGKVVRKEDKNIGLWQEGKVIEKNKDRMAKNRNRVKKRR